MPVPRFANHSPLLAILTLSLALATCGPLIPNEISPFVVLPQGPSVRIGEATQFSAVVMTQGAAAQDVTAFVAWQSSAEGVATISADGLASALTNGKTTITASYNGVVATTTLTVMPPPPTLTSIAPDRGPTSGGTTVIIDGTHLGDATAVMFDDLPATSFAQVSDTSVVAVAPAGRGAVNVAVTTPGGVSNSIAFSYGDAPTVSTTDPTVGLVAGGTVITLTGSHLAGATAVRFGTAAAASFQVNSDTEITVTAPAHAPGAVELQVATPFGDSNTVTFSYGNTPILTSLSPTLGLVAGGAVVTLTGSFFSGTTAVLFGASPATSFTVVSDSQVNAVAPAGTSSVNVTLTTPYGSTGALPFAYGSAPAIMGLNPSVGLTTGGVTVTLTGTHLTGLTTVLFGTTPGASLSVVSDSQATVVAPAMSAGVVDVTAVNAFSLSNAITFAYGFVPTLTSITPNLDLTSGGTVVTLIGEHFTGATSVKFGTNATSFTVISDTQISAVTPPGMSSVNVAVTTPFGTSPGLSFGYGNTPTLTVLSPNFGLSAGGTTVTLTGTNLAGTSGVTFDNTDAAAFTVDSDVQITAVSPPGTGSVNVRATTPFGTSNGLLFSYGNAPTLTSVSPVRGLVAGGASITLVGAHLSGTTSISFGTTLSSSFTVVSDTQVTVIAPLHVAGDIEVKATTPYGASNGITFSYGNAPTLVSLSPTLGLTAGGAAITLTGTYFPGATAVSFGGVAASSFTVDSAGQITAVSPAHGDGATDVAVTTPYGTTAPLTFTFGVAPTLTGISPSLGLASGGASVTITGTHFAGATDVRFGAISATTFTVASDTQIIALSPPGAGTVSVTVATPFGVTTGANFAYGSLPAVTGVSPSSGAISGGTSVAITGSGFASATAISFGSTAASAFTVDSDTQITAVSPSNGAGIVDVTVTTLYGTSSTSSADQFTYTAPPTVTGVSPSSGAVSVGTPVTITGSGFASTTVVSFGSTAASAFTIDSDTQITVVSPVNSAGTVDVTVTTVFGTSAISSADEFTYESRHIIFLTNSLHNGNFGGFSGANSFCNSDSAKPSSGFAAAYTYKALLNGNNATVSGVSYYRTDGTTRVATATGGNLVGTSSLMNAISSSSGSMWTGSSSDCSAWSSSSGTGSVGVGNSPTSTWWNTGTASCVATRKLYCVSQ